MDATSSKTAAPHGKTTVEDSTEDESPPVPNARRPVSEGLLEAMRIALTDNQVERQNFAAVGALKKTFDSRDLRFVLFDGLFDMVEHRDHPYALPLILSLLNPRKMELLLNIVSSDPGTEVIEAAADSTRAVNQQVPEGSIGGLRRRTARSGGQRRETAHSGGQPAESAARGHHDEEPYSMGDAGQGGGHAGGHESEEEADNFGLTGTGAGRVPARRRRRGRGRGEETAKYNGYGYHRLTPKTFHKEFVRFEGIHGDFKARHYCCMLLNVDSFEKLANPPLTSLSELVLLHQIVNSPEDTVEEWALRDTTTEKLGQMYIVDRKVYGSVNAEGWTKSVYRLRGNNEWQVLVYTLDALSHNKADQLIEAVDALCKRFEDFAQIDDASTQTILGLLK